MQTHFPDSTRPGPQLFSFKADDLLSKAWKHAALEHLRPKWMYTSFDDSAGGAIQGIIPVQDARGNILGGAGSSSENQSKREAKKQVKEGSMLEERFEKMMEAVEKNTEQIAALTESRQNGGYIITPGKPERASEHEDQFSTSELTSHLGRISQLLEQNSAHVAKLAERQVENEEKMRTMLESQQAQKETEQPSMAQLTSHLDRIQRLMERNTHGRKDSARDIRTSPQRIDLTPLTFWLEKVLGAVEQNSDLVRDLLEARNDSTQALPAQQVELDLSPLSQRLDDLLDAQEAKAARDQEANVQMAQRLDKIADTHNKAVERGPFDVSLLSQRLDEILSVHRDAATTPLVAKLDEVAEAHKEAMDFSPITDQLEELGAEVASLREALDFSTLVDPLEAIRNSNEQNSEHLVNFVEAHYAPSHEAHSQHFETVIEQLEALRTTTEHNSGIMTDLLESIATTRPASSEESTSALTPFDDRSNGTSEQQSDGPGFGNTKFIISALTSHLSKIQAVAESNANAVRSTRESSQAFQRSMSGAISDTSQSIRTLAAKHKDLSSQVAVREGLVREVVRSQAEMVECVRELAQTIKGQERNTCNHVVVPPPRKTNRKVVGFVYDVKEGKA